ncbi:MAG: DSD1 family PLP-dependent enzyme [Geminicoccaceae bacterium]
MMTTTSSPNAHLIGRPGSRHALCTPVLLIDLDAMERNIAAMAAFCRDHDVALRPHAKTHKSVEIARRQRAAGAVGICVATIGEAECLTAGGIDQLLITSPVSTAPKLARLTELHREADGLSVVVDSVDAVEALSALAGEVGKPLTVLVDLGIGLRRTGCADNHAAMSVITRITRANSLQFGGIQAYAGHLQHIANLSERQRRDEDEGRAVDELCGQLEQAGIPVPKVTGAGTGTHAIDAAGGLFSELQCGSYIFMDADYSRIDLRGGKPPFEPALFVRTSVISANAQDHVTTDAGLKHFATDCGVPTIMRGAPDCAVYAFFGDEHGRVNLKDAPDRLPLGTALECLTPHCDPTVNLHSVFHVISGDRLVDIWPIDARGAI